MSASLTLLNVLWYYPIAVNLASHVTAGDLLRLARVNSDYRAILHNFPLDKEVNEDGETGLRQGLYLGLHQTNHWVNLKERARWECGSPKHTKGSPPKHCRYCSIPICESCIVRDAFKKSERTYLNRTRFLCRSCWSNGKPHRAYRFGNGATSHSFSVGSNPYAFNPDEGDLCACTVKDGWICAGCKDKQNAEAIEGGFKFCYGESCPAPLEDDKDRRRICLWCDRPMIKGRSTLERRAAYDRWCFDRALADRRKHRLEDMQRRIARGKVFKSARISRRDIRELRKLPSFEDDDENEVDKPCLLATLAIVDYHGLVVSPPSLESFHRSLEGNFRYSEEFLFQFKTICTNISKAKREEIHSRSEGLLSGNTNLQTNTIDARNFVHGGPIDFYPISRTSRLNKDRRSNRTADVHNPGPGAWVEPSRKRSFGQRFDPDLTRKRKLEEGSQNKASENSPQEPLEPPPSFAKTMESSQAESSQVTLVTRQRHLSTEHISHGDDGNISQSPNANETYSPHPVNADDVTRDEDFLNSDHEYDDDEMMEAVIASLTHKDGAESQHASDQNEGAASDDSDDSDYMRDFTANLPDENATGSPHASLGD